MDSFVSAISNWNASSRRAAARRGLTFKTGQARATNASSHLFEDGMQRRGYVIAVSGQPQSTPGGSRDEQAHLIQCELRPI